MQKYIIIEDYNYLACKKLFNGRGKAHYFLWIYSILM